MDQETTMAPGSPPQPGDPLAALQAELDQTKAELARLQIESESELNASHTRCSELESKLTIQSEQRSQLDESLLEIQRLKTSLEARVEKDQHLHQQLQNLQSEKADLLQVIRDKENEFSDLEG
jgi:DNA repair exonuclease SbcCD ATPase subunit